MIQNLHKQKPERRKGFFKNCAGLFTNSTQSVLVSDYNDSSTEVEFLRFFLFFPPLFFFSQPAFNVVLLITSSNVTKSITSVSEHSAGITNAADGRESNSDCV